jgi:hypothetical protein
MKIERRKSKKNDLFKMDIPISWKVVGAIFGTHLLVQVLNSLTQLIMACTAFVKAFHH